MATQLELQEHFKTPTLEHLDDAEIEVLAGAQAQGDVLVFPITPGEVAGLKPVGPEGIVVVKGEAGGNTHVLRAIGDVKFSRNPNTNARDLRLGTCVVAEGATAYLDHLEHGFSGIGPGTYQMNRQRQQAQEIALVAD